MAIGFYALEPISLPHPPYPMATLRLIEMAIAHAWRIIRDHPQKGFDITTATEDQITRELGACLVNTVQKGGLVPGFTKGIFYISREAKFVSFDGSSLDKMPDFHIDIARDEATSLPSDDGLFIECKPIDLDHPAGKAYCNKGISRYVNGEYAWALTEALMVGYAAPGYSMPGKLTAAFRSRKADLHLVGPLKPCTIAQSDSYVQKVYISVHERPFSYPDTNKAAPNLVLRHLWLYRS